MPGYICSTLAQATEALLAMDPTWSFNTPDESGYVLGLDGHLDFHLAHLVPA